MNQKIVIDGHEFNGVKVTTEHSCVLIISCDRGFLGCGYFDLAVAERVGDCVAIVTGVKSFDDMIAAKVLRHSGAAAARGIVPGITGKDALLAMVK